MKTITAIISMLSNLFIVPVPPLLAVPSSLLVEPAETVALSEISGTVYGPHQVPLQIPATVLVYSDDLCVGAAETGPEGNYLVTVEPGRYTLRVMIGGQEAANRSIDVPTGSWVQDLEAILPFVEMSPLATRVDFSR
jgi:hypothetical protein